MKKITILLIPFMILMLCLDANAQEKKLIKRTKEVNKEFKRLMRNDELEINLGENDKLKILDKAYGDDQIDKFVFIRKKEGDEEYASVKLSVI